MIPSCMITKNYTPSQCRSCYLDMYLLYVIICDYWVKNICCSWLDFRLLLIQQHGEKAKHRLKWIINLILNISD